MLSFLIFSSFLILCTSLPTQLYALFFKKKTKNQETYTLFINKTNKKKIKIPKQSKMRHKVYKNNIESTLCWPTAPFWFWGDLTMQPRLVLKSQPFLISLLRATITSMCAPPLASGFISYSTKEDSVQSVIP